MNPITIIAAASLTASASATFIGVQWTDLGGGPAGTFTVSIGVAFTNPNDELLSVFNFAGNYDTFTFQHSDLVGQSFAPQFSTAAWDSRVTIGGAIGIANTTSAGVGWGPQGFNQPTIVDGAGWFNSSPGNGQGNPTNGVTEVMVLTFASGLPALVGSASISWRDGAGATHFDSASFNEPVPSPGAGLILLGLFGSRRRR